jgi:ParB family chromosome partitioning protein
MALYREGGLTPDQITAFCLTDDQARQEQVLDALSWNRDPWMIRRLLTEGRVPAHDRRAVYVGVEAYEAAGGTVLRDLFTEDDGGWLEDAGLLDRLALTKLEQAAAEVQAWEGWRWAQAAINFPHAHGLRRVYPRIVERNAEDETRLAALVEEQEALAMQHDGVLEGDLPPDVASRLEELAREIDALSEPAYAYEPEEIARGGAFVRAIRPRYPGPRGQPPGPPPLLG